MQAGLPPGPRLPAPIQTVGWWTRPTAYAHRLRARYGPRFTMRLLGQPPFVILTDPADVKALFTAPPDALHPGEGARLLEPIVGRNSVILLDEAPHMEQRRLLLPAFHGDRMQRLTGLIADLAEREIADWPTGEPVALHARLQRLTLEIILRAVFGLDEGERLDALRTRLAAILSFGDSPVSMLPAAQRALSGRGRFGRFERDRAEVDRHLYELMAERRASAEEREDVLEMLLAARHGDGSPMSDEEIRDELLTALVAGHETTASSLSFAFEALAHAPDVQERIREDDGGAYLQAAIHEVLRRWPVLPNPEPRLVMRPYEIGGWTYPAGVVLIASAVLIHHDPEIYADPFAFRPERFLDRAPGTYTWIPFGGGRRRCLGASFALLEMRLALQAALERFDVLPAAGALRARRRMITITPAAGARVVLRARDRRRRGAAVGAPEAAAAA
jgi:cytochrome P450